MRYLHSRVLHRVAPQVHRRRPPLPDLRRLRHDIRGVEPGELGLIRRVLPHVPEEAALGVGVVAHDVQGPLVGREAPDDVQARLVDGALGLLGVLERRTNLVAELRALVLLQQLRRLREVVLQQVQEALVVAW